MLKTWNSFISTFTLSISQIKGVFLKNRCQIIDLDYSFLNNLKAHQDFDKSVFQNLDF